MRFVFAVNLTQTKIRLSKEFILVIENILVECLLLLVVETSENFVEVGLGYLAKDF